MTNESSFNKLLAINVRDKVEQKNGMDYLSWAYAWQVLKQNYPDAQRRVYESPATGLNYFSDGRTGYVKVGITIGDIEHIDYLPIMDHRNRAIPVENINSFDVNKSIQRSTVKAIAMHGLGIQLWTGEDLPAETSVAPSKPATAPAEPKLIPLKKDDENWSRVIAYLQSNAGSGDAATTASLLLQLSRKYSWTPAVEKTLRNIIEVSAKAAE